MPRARTLQEVESDFHSTAPVELRIHSSLSISCKLRGNTNSACNTEASHSAYSNRLRMSRNIPLKTLRDDPKTAAPWRPVQSSKGFIFSWLIKECTVHYLNYKQGRKKERQSCHNSEVWFLNSGVKSVISLPLSGNCFFQLFPLEAAIF